MKTTALLTAALLAFGCGRDDSRDKKPLISDTGTDRGPSDDTGPEPEPDCTDFTMDFLEGSTDLPSVIQIIFRLKCDGEPVPGLDEEDFSIFEDGESISVFESDQQIVPTVARYQLSTLLMLDMSGSMVESGNLPALQAAASTFIDKLGGEQEVAVYTFDGQESPTLLVPFTSDDALLDEGIASLTDYEIADTSTNLNGAVLSGLSILDVEATEHTDKLFGGTLAIFTDGKDQAGRVANDVAAEAAQGSAHSVYSVGLGGEIAEDHLGDIGKDGALFSEDVDDLSDTFDALAADILAEANSLYILAYCSPKRAGTHDLKLKLNDSTAKLNYTFDATGFEGGCDPSYFVPPEFLDADGDGYRPYDGDCDDDNASTFPGAAEACDGVDNNCNDEIDEEVTITVYYDADSDGYGDPEASLDACDGVSGYVSDNTDCDDDDYGVNPDALEYCDGIDNDCNGLVDDAGESFVYYRDADGDGVGDEESPISSTECSPPEGHTATIGDCDDSDPEIYPGADEYCNETDDDCDGDVDEAEDAVDATSWYRDGDGDGYGDDAETTEACSAPSGYVARGGDCDDDDPGVTTGGETIYYRDGDGDGFGTAAFTTWSCSVPEGYAENDDDCDDRDSDIYPGAGDDYGDGVDSDCDELDCQAAWDGSTYYAVCSNDGAVESWLSGYSSCLDAGYDGLATGGWSFIHSLPRHTDACNIWVNEADIPYSISPLGPCPEMDCATGAIEGSYCYSGGNLFFACEKR